MKRVMQSSKPSLSPGTFRHISIFTMLETTAKRLKLFDKFARLSFIFSFGCQDGKENQSTNPKQWRPVTK